MDLLGQLIATWEGPIGRAFLASVRGMRDRVPVRDLARAIAARDLDAALRAINATPSTFQPLADALADFFGVVGREVSRTIPAGRGAVGLSVAAEPFDPRAPAADQWLRVRTADLVSHIIDDQRNLVRAALAPLSDDASPMITGNTPEKIALDLVGRISRTTRHREGGILGLTPQQTEWARNYEAEVAAPSADALTRKLRDRRFDPSIERAIREGTPIPAEKRAAMVAAYRNNVLRLRGEVIARAEADAVAIAAQEEAWAQAIGRGAVEEGNLRRFWLTAGDDAVRPSHAAVPRQNAAGVGFREPFATPKGPTMNPGWEFDPGCRCRVRVRVVSAA